MFEVQQRKRRINCKPALHVVDTMSFPQFSYFVLFHFVLLKMNLYTPFEYPCLLGSQALYWM